MRKFIVPVAALAGVLATVGAFAQDTQPQHGGMQHGGTTQTTPMQGGMCGPGGCGMGAPGQGTPMQGQGQAQGQGGRAMGGCPMMQRSAAMEQRLRRLEERMGIPAPPTPPSTQPGSPG
jgi:hypothetical protein